MSRYIDADLLNHLMYTKAFHEDSDMQMWDSGCWIRYKMFEKALKETPTADVRENKHGEWMFSADDSKGICSECQYILYGKKYQWRYLIAPYNFCPNCGADMREVEE